MLQTCIQLLDIVYDVTLTDLGYRQKVSQLGEQLKGGATLYEIRICPLTCKVNLY